MNVKEDAKVVKPFLHAVENVISTMAMVEVKAGKPYMKRDNVACGDVSGIISMSGDRNGTISVTFSEAAIKVIVSNMLGEQITEMNQDVKDAVGELTNMISGQARRGLAEIGMTMNGGIPTVITGKDHSISHICKDPLLAIPFETPNGPFTVEVSLE
ncbi:MAG: chemotaxis protein CheX [Thermodesulfobacteriota bacterium]